MDNLSDEAHLARPLPVTILLVFVLSMTAWYGIRIWTTIADWDVIFRFRGNPFYVFTTGILWFIIGMVLVLILFRGSHVAPQVGLGTSMLYLAWYWIDRLVIQASPTSNEMFSIFASAIILIIFDAALLWPSSRAFFKETK